MTYCTISIFMLQKLSQNAETVCEVPDASYQIIKSSASVITSCFLTIMHSAMFDKKTNTAYQNQQNKN